MRVGELQQGKPRLGSLGRRQAPPPKPAPAVWSKEDWAVVYRVVAKLRAVKVRTP